MFEWWVEQFEVFGHSTELKFDQKLLQCAKMCERAR